MYLYSYLKTIIAIIISYQLLPVTIILHSAAVQITFYTTMAPTPPYIILSNIVYTKYVAINVTEILKIWLCTYNYTQETYINYERHIRIEIYTYKMITSSYVAIYFTWLA